MLARIADGKVFLPGNHPLTKRMGKGSLARFGPRFAETDLALEKLAVLVHERHERYGRAEQ
ncbi:MAG: hypothetical protein OEP48_16705, partial [Betaproteobacteria bacterium]|nr:hypothetical protein [Betaproteobacteria bacterium]